jgi:hypothetical protein
VLAIGPLVALAALKAILVDHDSNSAASLFVYAADHAATAVDLDIRLCAQNIGWHGNSEIHRGTHRHVGVDLKQHSVSGNDLALRMTHTQLRLHRDGQLKGKAHCTLQIGVLRSSSLWRFTGHRRRASFGRRGLAMRLGFVGQSVVRHQLADYIGRTKS